MDDDVRSCKDKSKVKCYYGRTAGVLSITRPCGIRLGIIFDFENLWNNLISGIYEMYVHESLSQVSVALYGTIFSS